MNWRARWLRGRIGGWIASRIRGGISGWIGSRIFRWVSSRIACWVRGRISRRILGRIACWVGSRVRSRVCSRISGWIGGRRRSWLRTNLACNSWNQIFSVRQRTRRSLQHTRRVVFRQTNQKVFRIRLNSAGHIHDHYVNTARTSIRGERATLWCLNRPCTILSVSTAAESTVIGTRRSQSVEFFRQGATVAGTALAIFQTKLRLTATRNHVTHCIATSRRPSFDLVSFVVGWTRVRNSAILTTQRIAVIPPKANFKICTIVNRRSFKFDAWILFQTRQSRASTKDTIASAR
mmetsp:Transcript_45809/g.76193  ORF Transcript_45809/g.76193 Transcript_45809/m.76193 type:complete len:292 (-) Transcript_45809:607-1482(-)